MLTSTSSYPLRRVLLGACAGIVCTLAQAHLKIHRDSEVVGSFSGPVALMQPTECDDRGNFYVRGVEPRGTQTSLMRLSPDLKEAALFDVAQAAKDDLTVKNVAAFSVRADGKVFQLVYDTKDRSAIAEFDKSGTYRRLIRLEGDFVPVGLAAFQSGSFLVSGLRVISRDPNSYLPTLRLFDDSGNFLQEIVTNEPDLKGSDVLNTVSLGGMQSWGNYVYILRQARKPYILLISASGEVLRKLKLDLPEDGMRVGGFDVGSGRMLVRYYSPEASSSGRQEKYYSLYENLEGHKLVDYTESDDIHGAFVCYDWKNTFSYISTDDKGHQLVVRGVVR